MQEYSATTFEKMNAALEARKDRSAWSKGVTLYAAARASKV